MTDLADFVARHARPYDPETDTYRRPPFASPELKVGVQRFKLRRATRLTQHRRDLLRAGGSVRPFFVNSG